METKNIYVTDHAAKVWSQLIRVPCTTTSGKKLVKLLIQNSEYYIEDEEGVLYCAIPSHIHGRFLCWAVICESNSQDGKRAVATVKKHRDIAGMFPELVEEMNIPAKNPIRGRFLFLYKTDDAVDWCVITDDHGRTRFRFYDIEKYLEEDIDEFNIDPI